MKMRQAEEKKERERDTRRRRAAELQSQISIVGGRFVNEGEQNNYTSICYSPGHGSRECNNNYYESP